MRLFGRKRKAPSPAEMVASVKFDECPRKMIVQQSKLLALPDEILINIVRFLEPDHLETRLVCLHLRELVDPLSFKDYHVSDGRKSQRLEVLLSYDERRARWLRSVLVSTRYDEDQGLERFPRCLSTMRNLKRLVLETPDCNSKSPEDRVKWVRLQKQYEDIFKHSSLAILQEDRLLPSLEECTIHFVDDTVSLYPLTRYSSVFLHPTLKSLTLSCACTDTPARILRDYRQYKHTTALEHVHFEECDFNADTLEILLKFPKELKSLEMSEGVRYTIEIGNRPSRLHGNLNPGLLSLALSRSVGTSLEKLSLALGYQRSYGQNINSPGRSLDLTSLFNLKRLEVSMATLGLLFTRPKCDHQTHCRLPPSIETLRVFSITLVRSRAKPAKPFQTCLIKDKAAHGLPNLRHLIHSYVYLAPRGRSSFGILQQRGDRMPEIINQKKENVKSFNDKAYHIYRTYNVRVTIETEATPPGFIPPYLHNEEKPQHEVLWDTTTPTPRSLLLARRAQAVAREAFVNAGIGGRPRDEEDEPDYSIFSHTGLGMNDDDSDSDSDEDDEEDNPIGLMHVGPQAQDWLDMLIMQPGQAL